MKIQYTMITKDVEGKNKNLASGRRSQNEKTKIED